MANVMAKEDTQTTSATLGDVLYAKSKALVPEQDWATLVQSIAAGDQLALHALYERAHRIVFTLIMRITANRETAEELTVDVFHDVWRRASRYDPANGTVLGWIMNQARSRAIDRLRFESRQKRNHGDVPWGPLREQRDNLRLRRSGIGGERDGRGRSPYRHVPGLPARAGEPPPGARQVRLLAH
jgi:hypothetical protein